MFYELKTTITYVNHEILFKQACTKLNIFIVTSALILSFSWLHRIERVDKLYIRSHNI